MRKGQVVFGIALFIAIATGLRLSGVGEIDRIVKSLNVELPKMVDDTTRLDSIETNSNVIIYKYTLVDLNGDLENVEQIKKEMYSHLINQYCHSDEMRSVKRKSIRLLHTYRNAAGKIVVETSVDGNDC